MLRLLLPKMDTSRSIIKNTLYWAIRRKSKACAEVLLASGIDFEVTRDYSERTALYYATAYKWMEISKDLLERGSNPNLEFKTTLGYHYLEWLDEKCIIETLLHRAARNNC